jgi:hypothetical protein
MYQNAHRHTCGKGQTQAHTSKKLLALLNHSFWGVQVAGGNQLFTSALEKLNRHRPAMEYQHEQGHTSNIFCRIQKNHRRQCCGNIPRDITLQQGEQQWPQMA